MYLEEDVVVVVVVVVVMVVVVVVVMVVVMAGVRTLAGSCIPAGELLSPSACFARPGPIRASVTDLLPFISRRSS